MKHFYEKIPGMMDYEDLYSEMVKEFPSGSVFVELGVWYGRSAAYMATEILNSGKDIQLYCVDWFLKSSIEKAKENLKQFDFVHVIKDNTDTAARLFKDESVDFCFVDADHSFLGVQRDIQAWLPKVKGIIAGHDYGNDRYPYLVEAVNELLPVEKKSKMCWLYDKRNA